MHTFFLRFTGVVFSSYGAYLCVEPQFLINLLALGDSVPAAIEVRAMYGGLQLGFGLFLLWSGQRPPVQQQVAYALLIASFAGLAGGRGVGMLLATGDSYNLPAFIYESASLLVSVYLYVRLRSVLATQAAG